MANLERDHGIKTIYLEISKELNSIKQGDGELLDRIKGLKRRYFKKYSVDIPTLSIIENPLLESCEYCVKINGIDSGRGKILMDSYLCIENDSIKNKIKEAKIIEPVFGLPALWAKKEEYKKMEKAGYTVVDPPSIIFTHLNHIIRNYVINTMGIKEIKDHFDELGDVLKSTKEK